MNRLPTAPSSVGLAGKTIISPLSLGLVPLPQKMKSSARYVGPPSPFNYLPIPLELDVAYLINIAVNCHQVLRFPCPSVGGALIQVVGPPYGLAGKFAVFVRFGHPPFKPNPTTILCDIDAIAGAMGVAIAFPQVSAHDVYIWVQGFADTTAYLSVIPYVH